MMRIDISINGKDVAIFYVQNDATGDLSIGNYDVIANDNGHSTRNFRLENFDRSHGPVMLSACVLSQYIQTFYDLFGDQLKDEKRGELRDANA